MSGPPLVPTLPERAAWTAQRRSAATLAGVRAAAVLAPTDVQYGAALHRIGQLLAVHTGHAVSEHKPAIVLLQVEWRMGLLHFQNLADYVGYLEQTPNEVYALMHDLLVGLTQFFRDANTFASLETRIIPQLLETKPPGAALRVWVAGCSSGEEAYSIAMLLHAAMHSLHKTCAVQIFATDINCGALAVGRCGHYAPDIACQLSAERLTTYFTAEPDGSGYRIRPFIRDMLIFSEHDVNQDPPFTHIDLLSCRNVMIYMGVDAQTRLLRRFHSALRPRAALVLGTSEDIGESQALFSEWERDTKIYQRKQNQPDAMSGTGPTAMPDPPSPAGFGQDGSPPCGVRGEAALHALWNHARGAALGTTQCTGHH